MKSTLTFLAGLALLSSVGFSQTLDQPDTEPADASAPPPKAAIVEDPDAPAATEPAQPAPAQEEQSPDNKAAEPVAPPTQEPEPPAPAPKQGVEIRVEAVSGKTTAKPEDIQITAPFPAKPLSETPAGWKLVRSDKAKPFTKEVDVAGSKLTLTIHPHILTPDDDGLTVFSVSEPGYQAALQYQQVETVGAILQESIQQNEAESNRMKSALENLRQLLESLPSLER